MYSTVSKVFLHASTRPPLYMYASTTMAPGRKLFGRTVQIIVVLGVSLAVINPAIATPFASEKRSRCTRWPGEYIRQLLTAMV